MKVFLWLLKIKIPLFIYFKIFVGEEHLLCGDQRHCDKESEAGEMCAGAFSSFIFFIIICVHLVLMRSHIVLLTKTTVNRRCR